MTSDSQDGWWDVSLIHVELSSRREIVIRNHTQVTTFRGEARELYDVRFADPSGDVIVASEVAPHGLFGFFAKLFRHPVQYHTQSGQFIGTFDTRTSVDLQFKDKRIAGKCVSIQNSQDAYMEFADKDFHVRFLKGRAPDAAFRFSNLISPVEAASAALHLTLSGIYDT